MKYPSWSLAWSLTAVCREGQTLMFWALGKKKFGPLAQGELSGLIKVTKYTFRVIFCLADRLLAVTDSGLTLPYSKLVQSAAAAQHKLVNFLKTL